MDVISVGNTSVGVLTLLLIREFILEKKLHEYTQCGKSLSWSSLLIRHGELTLESNHMIVTTVQNLSTRILTLLNIKELILERIPTSVFNVPQL